MRRRSFTGLRIVVLGVGVVRMVVPDFVFVPMMLPDRVIARLIGGTGLGNPAIRGHMNMRIREDRGQGIERQRQPGKIKIPVDPHGAVGSSEQTRRFRAYSKAGVLRVNNFSVLQTVAEGSTLLVDGRSAGSWHEPASRTLRSDGKSDSRLQC
jgi:hypothetical protein